MAPVPVALSVIKLMLMLVGIERLDVLVRAEGVFESWVAEVMTVVVELKVVVDV